MPPDTLAPEDLEDWAEFDLWMKSGDPKECLYTWLTWENGTFVLRPEDAQAKAMERFRLFQSRKRGIVAARANLKLVVDNKTKPTKQINLKDLII